MHELGIVTPVLDTGQDAWPNIRKKCSLVSYNIREDKEVGAGRVQRGGTTTILREELTTYINTSGVDPSKLGHWSWYLLEGEERYQTRVVTAYVPCGSTVRNTGTYYQQQVRYIVETAPKTIPKEMSQEDILAQLRKWRAGWGQHDSHDG